jgi:hypothetical protein
VGQLSSLGLASPALLNSTAAANLRREWASTLNSTATISQDIPKQIRDAIDRSISAKIKTYRYVLPTQLLAKATEPSVDCRAVQANAAMTGAFDARSLCQQVIVPFDRATECVLGASPEPYANNPLRIPAIVASERSAQKDAKAFDDLCLVLDFTQQNPALATDLLRIALQAILLRLATVRVVYPTPNRVSQSAAVESVSQFLKEKTGGIRLQALSVSLFRAIGDLYSMFDTVRSNNINAADASTGSATDLECIRDNVIQRAVEVKDRKLSILHIQDKLPGLREKGITEAVFVVQGGVTQDEAEQINAVIQKEFSSGQNIYVAEFFPFVENHLILFGENGRRRFLQLVCEELDIRNADVSHRQRWRDILAAI